jgi:FMNH2-dependent dimethyl sulfone monooxygenase
LKQAGCDGIQINFFDFEPDLAYFGQRVLPLMQQAGLRH